MAEAYLMRRGGGSKVELKVAKYSSVNALPATGKEGNIAVITELPIGGVYVQSSAPADAAVGSLFFSSIGSDTTLLAVGDINFMATGAFIRTETGWAAVDTYVFRDDTWVFAPSGKLTEAGTDYTEYTGGFVARKISSRSDASATPAVPKVVWGSENVVIDTTKATGVNGVGMWCTDKAIDLTPYKTIVFEGTFSSNYPSYANNFCVAAWSKIPTYYTNDRLAFSSVTVASTTNPIQIDVSSINGSAYIGIGMAYSKATITRCYMIPKEETA